MSSLFSNYWIVSVPGEPNKTAALGTLMENVQGKGLASVFRCDIPELKVGTLDLLMQISDEMGKQDLFVESTVTKVAANLSLLLERDTKVLETSLTANGMSVRTYLQQFQWNEAKFPTKIPIKEIIDSIMKQVAEIDNQMKNQMVEYNKMKTDLVNMERKQTGNLLVRSLNDIVVKENFVLNSEFLVTLLVVVPKHSYKEWQASYEKLCDMVVPRSSQKITEDKDYGLFAVTVFKKFADDFKQASRENRFIVRDFEFHEEEIEIERKERTHLGAEIKKKLAHLTKWCKTNFSEGLEAWMHLKAIRAFVESVLRYGLPPNFQAAVIELNIKNEKKIRTSLKQLYGHLGASSDESEEPSLATMPQGEFFPYVFFNINLDAIK